MMSSTNATAFTSRQARRCPTRELIVSYQVRDRNRVLKLQRAIGQRGVSRRVNAALTAGSCHHIQGGASNKRCSLENDLVISQARLRKVDFEALSQFLARHLHFETISFQAVLLERIDAMFPLLEFLSNQHDCQIKMMSFTATEVLDPSDKDGLRSNSGRRNTSNIAGSIVRPLLDQFPSHIASIWKLTLRNVDLSGAEDGELLSRFLSKSPDTRALEMYQSILGPQGSRAICPKLIGSFGLRELYLRYCNLDEINGVSDLVQQVGAPESSVVTLGLYRNRSPPSLILTQLASVLKTTKSLQNLILSDSPFLFFSDPNASNVDDDASALQNFVKALAKNQTLQSLKIVCCGLRGSLIGPLIQAVEHKMNFTSLRLRGSRLEESGLIQLARSLPKLPKIATLEIFCSGDNLTPESIHEFGCVARQHTQLVEFEGSGWLDHQSQVHLNQICIRNMLLSKSNVLVKETLVPLGLWPHALAQTLSNSHCQQPGGGKVEVDHHLQRPNRHNTYYPYGKGRIPECGLSAAFIMIQAVQGFMVNC
mmetsp:Transcript_406/g.1118  ORF Transcript_406/g.1118 Transcript_406/m.1118 type:complete len:538 (+) Transcript_406:243-1856(+)